MRTNMDHVGKVMLHARTFMHQRNLSQVQRICGTYEDGYGYAIEVMTHARTIMSMQGNSWS